MTFSLRAKLELREQRVPKLELGNEVTREGEQARPRPIISFSSFILHPSSFLLLSPFRLEAIP
jgi:hypothetical protein